MPDSTATSTEIKPAPASNLPETSKEACSESQIISNIIGLNSIFDVNSPDATIQYQIVETIENQPSSSQKTEVDAESSEICTVQTVERHVDRNVFAAIGGTAQFIACSTPLYNPVDSSNQEEVLGIIEGAKQSVDILKVEVSESGQANVFELAATETVVAGSQDMVEHMETDGGEGYVF